jgi:hypothetical protein
MVFRSLMSGGEGRASKLRPGGAKLLYGVGRSRAIASQIGSTSCRVVRGLRRGQAVDALAASSDGGGIAADPTARVSRPALREGRVQWVFPKARRWGEPIRASVPAGLIAPAAAFKTVAVRAAVSVLTACSTTDALRRMPRLRFILAAGSALVLRAGYASLPPLYKT